MEGNTHIISNYMFFLKAWLDGQRVIILPLRGIQPEISESLEKVSVSTTFTKFRKVSVSKNLKLQSWESLSLDRFEN